MRPKILKGDDFIIILELVDSGVARNLTQLIDVEYNIYDSTEMNINYYTANLGDGVDIEDETSGKLFIRLPRVVTSSLPTGQRFHRCKITDQSGSVSTILGDYFNVVDEKYKMESN